MKLKLQEGTIGWFNCRLGATRDLITQHSNSSNGRQVCIRARWCHGRWRRKGRHRHRRRTLRQKGGEEQKLMKLFGKLETIMVNCKTSRGKKVGQGIFFCYTISPFLVYRDVSRLPNCWRCITFWTIELPCVQKLWSRRRLQIGLSF